MLPRTPAGSHPEAPVSSDARPAPRRPRAQRPCPARHRLHAGRDAAVRRLVTRSRNGRSRATPLPRCCSSARSARSLICALLILPRTGLRVFRTQRLGAHIGRNATQATAQSLHRHRAQPDAARRRDRDQFLGAAVCRAAAAIWLKEKIGRARGLALVIGFLGVLLVASPGADSFRIGALFAIANAVLYGSVTAAVRGMTATEIGGDADHVPDGAAHAVFRAGAAVLRLCLAGQRATSPRCWSTACSTASGNIGGRARCRWRRRPRSGRSIISRWSGRWCSASCSGATCRR